MEPIVSVVLPVYNAEPFLGQCLDSILMQTLKDIEIICVDDGSTDGSLSILQMYAMFDERLKLIHQENAGVGAARNRGLKEATGKFIISLDSDDFFEENMLEKMVEKADAENSDVVICRHIFFNNMLKQNAKEIQIRKKFVKQAPFKPEDLGEDLFSFCDMAAWNKLIRTKLIKENQLKFTEKTKYAEYSSFTCLALMLANKISILDTPFVYRRFKILPTISLYLDYYKGKCFNDCLDVSNHLWEQTKTFGLEQKYNNALISYIRQLLCDTLTACSSQERRENLSLIRKKLIPEIVQKLFSSATPKISVIIPVYNAAEFLPECLDSVINQTLKEIQIICVDDGSTDNCWEILTQYAQKDQRITILQQENQRQAIARNKAMEVATGTYIQFLDSDDYLEPDTCECLYSYSQLFNLEMCQLRASDFFNHNGENIENVMPIWFTNQFPPVFNYQTDPDRLTTMRETACLTIYDRSFLVKNNIHWINKKLAYEDTPFFTESIQKAKRVGALDAYFYNRRIHGSATTQQMANNFNDFVEVSKYTLNILKKITNPTITKLYCNLFLIKARNSFNPLELADKVKNASYLYELCCHIQNEYHFPLPKESFDWCLTYLKDKSKKEKLSFKMHALKTKCIRNYYTLNLFAWYKNGPTFFFKILGIPLLYSKVVAPKKTTTDESSNNTVLVKFLGCTLLKRKSASHKKSS